MLEGIRTNSQSIWVKIAFGIIILVFVFWGIGSVQTASNVVAKVNGEEITEQELLQSYNQQKQSIQQSLPSITDEQLTQMNFMHIVFQNLVMKSLLEQESERTGISVTPLELYEVISSFPFTHDNNGKFNQGVYEQALQNMGQTPKQFEDMIRGDMLEGKFQNLFANFAYTSPLQARQIFDFQLEQRAFDAFIVNDSEFVNEANPSNEEMQKLYDETKELYTLPASINLDIIEVSPSALANIESLTDEEIAEEYSANKEMYDTPEQVSASHILVLLSEEASAEEEEAALAKIKEAQARLANGEDFALVAGIYSDDVASAQVGGSLGAFTRGQMVKSFEDAAFSQEIGIVSEPVRSQFGYHLILVTHKEEAKALAEEQMREVVGAILAEKKAGNNIQSVVDALNVQILGGASLEDAAKKEGLEVESTGLLSFDVLQSTYNLTQTDIDKLKTATAGSYIENPLSTGSALLLAKVVENAPEKARNFEEVKDLILAEAKQAKAHEMAKAKAEELLKTIDANTPIDLESGLMQRNGASDIITSLALSEALFTAPDTDKSTWLPMPYETEDGYLLALPKEIVPADESLWVAQEEALLENMLQSRKEMFYNVFMQELHNNAEIEIVNDIYFQ